jgi:hypothetical protein
MSEHLENTAYEEEDVEGRTPVLTLTTARNMLPLVQRIVGDVLTSRKGLSQLQPEEERLHRVRRTLSWPERERRYAIQEELAALEKSLKEALAEMEGLGVALLDPAEGRVGFPTLVNGKRAFFSWQPGEDTLRHWHFARDNSLRPIPAGWFDESEAKPSRKKG